MNATGDIVGRAYRIAPGPVTRVLWSAWRSRGRANARVLDAICPRGGRTVDVGASRGMFSQRMLQQVGRDGWVVAAEPLPFNEPWLDRLDRRHPNFRYERVALSDAPGRGRIHVPTSADGPERGLASLRSGVAEGSDVEGEVIEVEVSTLDALVGSDVPVDAIKIDVEGWELSVLAGATAVLSTHPALLVEVEQRHHTDPIDHVFAWLRERGYEAWAVKDGGIAPLSTFDVERDQLRHVGGGVQAAMPAGYVNDFLFLHDAPAIVEALRV